MRQSFADYGFQTRSGLLGSNPRFGLKERLENVEVLSGPSSQILLEAASVRNRNACDLPWR